MAYISRIKPLSVTIGFFNAYGLANQRDQVSDFLRDHQIDIFLVQETLLKPARRDPKIANYNMVRNDRLSARGGGTVIYYRRALHCVPLDPPALANIEASVCRISLTGHAPIVIASVYLPPDKIVLSSDIEALLGMGSSVILAGDLNCKHIRWNSHTTTPNGRRLDALVDDLAFDIVAPLTPTHYPLNIAHRPDILDIALLKNVTLRLHSIEVVSELDSDHRPVVMKLGRAPDSVPVTRTVVDWHTLGISLAESDPPSLPFNPDSIPSPQDTAEAIDILTSHITSTLDRSSKQVVAEDFLHRFKLSDDIRELLRAKNASIRAYDRYPTAENRIRMRALQRDVKSRIAEVRDARWSDFLEGLAPSQRSYYRLARTLKSDTVVTMPPLVGPSGRLAAFDDDEKAELLADTLQTQCTPSTQSVDPVHVELVDSEVERRASLPPSDALPPVTPMEVKDLIKDLRPRKAPGSDGISNRVIKLLPVQLIVMLASIFNAAMANCIFPAVWKEADVIGIHKPGKPKNHPTSYRPISLLMSLGKLYERLLYKRLRDFVSSKGILIDEQFGFRTNHSCVQQVHRLTEHILVGLNRPKPLYTGALFFDVAKAFDKVWHNGLIFKLFNMGVPDSLVLIIRDFLSNRSFRYRVEGTRSSPRPLTAGVPQGSVLSPLLFSLFVNDIPRSPPTHLALFADDTTVYYSSRNKSLIAKKLQSAALALGQWFRKWRIDINPAKSTAVLFQRGSSTRISSRIRRRNLTPPITLFRQPIPWARKVKYLGVTLDASMTFRPHIKSVRDRAAFILGRLYPMICKRSKMSLRNKVTLYKTCIRPVMTYASVVFAHAARTHIDTLQSLQSRFCRLAVGAPWFVRNVDLHDDLGLESIRKYMKSASERYFDKAMRHDNRLIV
ncbi:hypothetical protein FEG28_18965, partial [Acinetobacter baumannii]